MERLSLEDIDRRLELHAEWLRSGGNQGHALSGKFDCSEMDLSGRDLRQATFNESRFIRCKLSGANFERAQLAHCNFEMADLTGAKLIGANFQNAHLSLANLTDARCDNAGMGSIDLDNANLSGAVLRRANLSGSNLRSAILAGADFRGAILDGVDFADAERAPQAVNLDLVNTASGSQFDACKRDRFDRVFDWEGLKIFGRLPLFGVSITVLILIPLFLYVLAIYNDKVDALRAWADRDRSKLAETIRTRLHPQPIPSQSMILFVSTLLLGAGSTIYALGCPSRIKEFSKDQWCDQLQRPLLHYWPLSWKHRKWRIVCAACYVVGGLGALWVLGCKLWHAGWYIAEHSTFTFV